MSVRKRRRQAINRRRWVGELAQKWKRIDMSRPWYWTPEDGYLQ